MNELLPQRVLAFEPNNPLEAAMKRPILPIFTIYDHPKDYPDHFVARRHDVSAGKHVPGPLVAMAATLEEARAWLPPGLHCLGRDRDDDPVIVESWI